MHGTAIKVGLATFIGIANSGKTLKRKIIKSEHNEYGTAHISDIHSFDLTTVRSYLQLLEESSCVLHQRSLLTSSRCFVFHHHSRSESLLFSRHDSSCRLTTKRHDDIQMKSGQYEPNYKVLSTMTSNARLRD